MAKYSTIFAMANALPTHRHLNITAQIGKGQKMKRLTEKISKYGTWL